MRYWLSVFKIPFSVLFPSILFFCCIGTYSINNNLDDIWVTRVRSGRRLSLPCSSGWSGTLLLGFILGPMLEENFRRQMLLSRGDFSSFMTHPISATLLTFVFVAIAWQPISFFRKGGKPAVTLHESGGGRLILGSLPVTWFCF